MKKLVLAAAAVLALGTGTAFAGGDYARSATATQSAKASGDRLAYVTSTRSQVSIYSTFRGDDYTQGGDQ